LRGVAVLEIAFQGSQIDVETVGGVAVLRVSEAGMTFNICLDEETLDELMAELLRHRQPRPRKLGPLTQGAPAT
jgi:hypothetical protein